MKPLNKMPHDEKTPTKELRKMLRAHHKAQIAPISKMTKIALMRELDKFAGTPQAQPSMAPVEVKRTEVSKEVAKMEEGKATKKKSVEKVVVPTGVQGVPQHASKKIVKEEGTAPKPVAMGRLVKGSAEARQFMASIRAKKTKKDNVD
jgi:hypothetical protein